MYFFYKSPEEIDFQFTVWDENNVLHNLDTIPASQGKETLRVVLYPDGDNADACKELRQKTVEWKELIKNGHLKREHACPCNNPKINWIPTPCIDSFREGL